jgi:dTDP-4-amino-4,6-dideoxygalactose transaminase
LRNQGRDVFDEWLRHSRLGYNYRMSELNAAVGAVQIRRLDELLNKRETVAVNYNQMLQKLSGVKPLNIVPNTTRMSWFVYVIRLDPEYDRDQVMTQLSEKGIPARPYFSPIHLQPFYIERFGYEPGDFPEAEAAGHSTLALPFHSNMSKDEIRVVIENLSIVTEQFG